MFKNLISGMVAGFGFSISVIVVFTLWFSYLSPFSNTSESITTSHSISLPAPIEDNFPRIENFSELPIDEKIANSTAIIVTTIEKDDSGIYTQRIAEVLKKEVDVELYYEVGDTYDDHSDYNQYETKGMFIPKGFIVFMGGSPASMRYSVSYSGDRISSLGGISLELLRRKCEP